MLDVLIRDAQVIDGSGTPPVRGVVGIRDGRIVLDAGSEGAQQVIDADGLVVAPGFIDIHTHYDAQVMWDPTGSPSSLHGVTTVVGGNCGFTIAPVCDESAEYVMRMLACVEGIPVTSLEAALDFGWATFAEWLAVLRRAGEAWCDCVDGWVGEDDRARRGRGLRRAVAVGAGDEDADLFAG